MVDLSNILMNESTSLTDTRNRSVEVYNPGPVSAISKVRYVVGIGKDPSHRTSVLNHTAIWHDLIDIIEMRILVFCHKL